MIGFLRRRLWNNRWLIICLLVGNVFLLGIVMGTPLFNAATMERIMQEDFRYLHHTRGFYPVSMQIHNDFNATQERFRHRTYRSTNDTWWPEVIEDMGLPSIMSIKVYTMTAWVIAPVIPRETPRPLFRRFDLVAASGFADNIEILHGRLPSYELVNGNIIEVMATEVSMHAQCLIMNELMSTRHVTGEGVPLYMMVVGIYAIREGAGSYWAHVPKSYTTDLLFSDRLAYEHFVRNSIDAYRLTVTWIEIMDHTAMRTRYVEHYLRVARTSTTRFNRSGDTWHFSVSFYNFIGQQDARTDRLAVTLWVLQIPIYVMLALYIYMVSRQILQMDRNEISVLISRGVRRRQILGLYALQGLFIAAVSFPIGLWLGVTICRMLGSSNGFLEMVQRVPLTVEVTRTTLLFGGVAVVFSFLAMFLPVIRFSKYTIIDHKRTTSGKLRKSVWQRYFIDVILFGAASYGLYSFNNQQEIMAASLTDSGAVDPLLYVLSSMFILGAGLLCLRIFPYMAKLVFIVGRRFFSPSVYVSMIKVVRSAGEEQFIMLFLVFTVAVGIFSAQSARTLNLNNAHRIQYMGGADLMFGEEWTDNIPPPVPSAIEMSPEFVPPVPPETLVYTEPDFSRFTHFEEVDFLTPVMRRPASLRASGRLSVVGNLNLMAIETHTFGETIWFRDDLLMVHMNYFLNLLATRADGVLLSDNFRTRLGYRVGDVVYVTEAPRMGPPGMVRLTVIGFIEYWPTFVPVERTRLLTGEIVETKNSLAVTNLGHLQTSWGVRPYEIWMRTNSGSNRFFIDFVNENRIRLNRHHDTTSALVAMQSDPIVQGTNGILTVGFIMTLIICFTGFLIYWILSIRSRVLQFGIFRAMGMSMRNIIGLLINEQFFITFMALAIGVFVGEVSAQLFVPLIQVSYTAAEQVIPLLVVIEEQDYRNLFGMLGIMITLCLVVLCAYISRIKIAQALKLGED